MTIVGIMILLGLFELRFADQQGSSLLRTMFGIVLTLYGIYRIAVSEMMRRRSARERHIHRDSHTS